MNYDQKKKTLIKEKNLLLKEYEILFYKTMKLAAEMGKIDELSLSPHEMIDWIRFATNDEEMAKLTRLTAALQYVESPSDKNVISALKENIKINKSNTK